VNRTLSKRLISAARKGHTRRVLQLLERGADVNAPGNDGHSALIEAARAGHEETVVALLRIGANVLHKTSQGRTALHWAASGGHPGVVRALLVHGADVKTTDECGWSPVVPTILHRREDIGMQLLEAGADPELVFNEDTLLSLAFRYDCKKLAAYLKQRSAR
jgi:uncharacterized protein